LFVADSLSSLIKKEIEENSLMELRLSRRGPDVSHLLFADDCLLFFEGSINQAEIIQTILDRYERSTGQLVSLGKCSILYGDQVPIDTQKDIKNILKYDTHYFEEKYLGLTVLEGRLKKGKLQPIKERFAKKSK
jgi:hypothetical protein